MFSFNGTIDRKAFAIGIALRVGIYAAFILLVPLILQAADASSSCKTSQANPACGISTFLFIVVGLPLASAALMLSLPGILVRRFRSIGVTPWLSLFVLLLLFADSQLLSLGGGVLFLPGSHSSVAWLLRPGFLSEALALMVVLCLIPERDGWINLRQLGWPAIAAIVFAVPIGFSAALRLTWSVPHYFYAPLNLIAMVPFLWEVLLIALPFVAGFALWPRQGQSTEPFDASPPAPMLRLIGAAAVLTIAVSFILPGNSPWALLVHPFEAGLRIFAVCLAMVGAAYLIYRWRQRAVTKTPRRGFNSM
jgi:uncharacterized membrane protein YhaH (DUF805 family)